MRLFGVTGWKDTGKTTLMERLVREISGRGFTVSTIKHAHHSFDVDHPGKDSFRHREAGARQVLVSSRDRWALMSENLGASEPNLEEFLAKLDTVDLVLVEGYKCARHPKIETVSASSRQEMIWREDPSIEAVASDAPIEELSIPLFKRDDIFGLADFVLKRVGLI